MMSKLLPKETLPCQPLTYSTASHACPSKMDNKQRQKQPDNMKPSNGVIASKPNAGRLPSSGSQVFNIDMKQTSYPQLAPVNRVCEPTYAQLNHSTKTNAGAVTSQPKRLSVPMEQSFVNDCYQNVADVNELNLQPPNDQSRCSNENYAMVDESHPHSFNMRPLHCSVITLCVSLMIAPYSICCSICGILNSVFAYVEHRHGNMREYRRLQNKSRCCTGMALSAALLLPIITIVLIRLILGKWVWEMISMSVRLKLDSALLAPTTPPLKLHLRI